MQVDAVRAEVAEFERGRGPETLLDGQAPLLDVLRRRVRVEGGEADGRASEHGLTEVEVRRDYPCGGREIVALLRFGEDVRDVVALVAPGVHVNGRVEDAEGPVEHKPQARDVLRDAEARGEVKLVRVHESGGKPLLSADEDEWTPVLEDEVRVGVADVGERTHVLVAQPRLNRRVARELEAVLHEGVGVPLAELHLRDAGLALLHRREAQEEAGERRACAVVRRRLRGEAVGELVVAAVLEEAPHGPDEASVAAAELEAVSAPLPTERVARFQYRVPRVHGRGDVRVAHGRVALHVEVWSAERASSAEADAADAEFGDDVARVAVFRRAVHREARGGDGGDVHHLRVDDASPPDDAVLREVVVERAEAGEVLRREAALAAERVAREQRVAAFECLVEAERALIGDVVRVACVHIVVTVHARADHGRRAHHRHTAPLHPHIHVGPGHVLL